MSEIEDPGAPADTSDNVEQDHRLKPDIPTCPPDVARKLGTAASVCARQVDLAAGVAAYSSDPCHTAEGCVFADPNKGESLLLAANHEKRRDWGPKM